MTGFSGILLFLKIGKQPNDPADAAQGIPGGQNPHRIH
jgi:hypothetical protein